MFTSSIWVFSVLATTSNLQSTNSNNSTIMTVEGKEISSPILNYLLENIVGDAIVKE